jgi:hypothetical protein
MKTMVNFLSLIILVGIFSLLTGCSPCYYVPNAQNVPVFSEKGQANGALSFQFGPLSTGANVQLALALTDHIGLMANYNHFSGRGESGTWYGDDYSSTSKSNMGEAGLGYYHPFQNKMVFETYAGIGASEINTEYERWDGDGSSSVHTTCYFIQPSIAYYKKNIRLAFSSRFRVINYRDITYNSMLGEGAKLGLIDLQQNPAYAFFEPAITFRAGGEKVKFQVQAGFSVILDQSYVMEYDPVNINIGIVFSLPGKKKREAE